MWGEVRSRTASRDSRSTWGEVGGRVRARARARARARVRVRVRSSRVGCSRVG
jgi:hypothetical protein